MARWAFVSCIALVLLVPLIFPLTISLWPRLIGIMALAWWLPGALLVAHWGLPDLDWITAGLVALGLGACWMILITLILHWLPGPITQLMLVGAYEFGALLLLGLLVWRRPSVSFSAPPRTLMLWIVALVVLAGALRLPALGYRELHNDETEVLYLARDAIQGEEDAYARHTKGPGELAIATVIYRSLDTISETTGRAPFALVGIAAVLATAILGSRLFSPAVGGVAGVLFAFNGYALALSRLIQYQPFILLLMALAVLAGWQFYQSGSRRWLALMIVLSTFALVLHYEFFLVVPVLLVLLWLGWHTTPGWQTTRTLVISGLLGVVPVLLSYGRMFFHPQFADTTLVGWEIRFGDIGAFNIPFFVNLSTLYNSTYYVAGFILLVAVGLVICWRTARTRALLLTVWFLPFLLLYLFVLKYPGTHFYMMMEGWAILGAIPLVRLTERRVLQPAARWSVIALIVGWLGLSAGYLYLAYFREAPEYVINYQEQRSPLYWTPYGEDIPQDWRFGFPILEGWKALGVLNEWHYIGDTYASNEQSTHLRWYLGGFHRVEPDESPDFVFMATHLRELAHEVDPTQMEGYRPVGEVRVRGEQRIVIWAREPIGPQFVSYDEELFEGIFAGEVPSFDEWPDPEMTVEHVQLGDTMTLVGAGMAPVRVAPGATVHVYMKWEPHTSLTRDYKLFVHVGADDTGQPLTQWDGLPGFNTARTSEWPVGDVFRDNLLIKIPDDMPAGEHAVHIGLYDAETGERLGGQAVEIGTVTVE